MIFLRFYYTGEFSKQFTTKIPLLRLAFYAVIPGVIVQSIGLFLYDCYDDQFDVLTSLEVFHELSGGFDNYCKAKYFINSQLHIYVCYTLLMALLAGLSGIGINYLIRKTKADIYLKILRFRNHWYYVLSGEIQQFQKYRNVKEEVNNTSIEIESNQRDDYKINKVMISYADILVSQNGASKMYSGYIADYELDSKDPHQLDKIYLIDVEKYNYLKDPQFKFQDKFIKKKIPGDLFIIENKQVLNMNITYIPFTKKIQKEQEKREERKRNKLIFNWIQNILFFLFVLFVLQLIFNTNAFNLRAITSQLHWIEKFVLASFFLLLISLLGRKEYIEAAVSEVYKDLSEEEKKKEVSELKLYMNIATIVMTIISLFIMINKIWNICAIF
ncbi:MAG: hypothetical protein BGO87_02630 [Flavobacteriia bacterium 40-80]|nr:MAG: hypothetical protein BGO87_02630 [Flavobacteriia bacterium 40-80]